MKKRILAAVVAAALALGATSALATDATKFTDAATIQNWDAVATLARLNVVDGKDNGAFEPEATVTRAEMAKLICLMLNGGVEPQWGAAMEVSFVDAQDHWAKRHIAYCDANGIISGRGDGNFDPDATVTGAEAAKMTLCMLGYVPSIFGFVGSNWKDNTMVYAMKVRLYVGLEALDVDKPMTRDQVAQMLYNSLTAKTMESTWDSLSPSGEITYKYVPGDRTFYERYFDEAVLPDSTPAPTPTPAPLPTVPAQPK